MVVVRGDARSAAVDAPVVSLAVKSRDYNGMDAFCVSNRKVNRLTYMHPMQSFKEHLDINDMHVSYRNLQQSSKMAPAPMAALQIYYNPFKALMPLAISLHLLRKRSAKLGCYWKPFSSENNMTYDRNFSVCFFLSSSSFSMSSTSVASLWALLNWLEATIIFALKLVKC